MRRAKIICTLGPSTSTDEAIEKLISAGMDVARLNFSHGDYDFHRSLANRVRAAAARLNKSVAILQDLQGPKIRTRLMKGGEVELKTGMKTCITTDDIEGTSERFATQYTLLPGDVKAGDLILIDDGKIAVQVLSVQKGTEIICEIVHGGMLKSNKGINVPTGGLSTASLTEKDIRDVHFGAEVGVDAVALSFVRSGEDIKHLRRELALAKTRPIVLAKIEKPQAVEALDEILDEADGVMVARGDLGVEIPLEHVPIVQKRIIDAGLKRGKTVIVATQMLESMITEQRPTRAEVSDVANAVLDGADMVMLSAETAAGAFPFDAVKTMDRVIRHTEESDILRYWRTHEGLSTSVGQRFQNAVSLSGVQAAEQLQAKAVVIFTSSGNTARLVSGYRPKLPIIAFVPNASEQRRLNFSWGVQTALLGSVIDLESLLARINAQMQSQFGFAEGDTVVLLTKVPLLNSQRTNTVHVFNLWRQKND
jgi:pyruvate kinase